MKKKSRTTTHTNTSHAHTMQSSAMMNHVYKAWAHTPQKQNLLRNSIATAIIYKNQRKRSHLIIFLYPPRNPKL